MPVEDFDIKIIKKKNPSTLCGCSNVFCSSRPPKFVCVGFGFYNLGIRAGGARGPPCVRLQTLLLFGEPWRT